MEFEEENQVACDAIVCKEVEENIKEFESHVVLFIDEGKYIRS
jgi:hypothetical protein